MKKILFSMALFCSSFCMAADVLVQTKDGGDYSFVIDNETQMSFTGTSLVIYFAEMEHRFELSNVANIRYGNVLIPEGIEEVLDKSSNPLKITHSEGAMKIENLNPGDAVHLYNVGGQLILSVKADNNGIAAIRFTALQKGIYIVESKGRTHKLILK